MIKKEKNHILIEPEDLIVAMQDAKYKDSDIFIKLQDLFISTEKMTDAGLYKIKKNSNIYKYLKTVNGIVFEEEFITVDVLATSLARSIYECNHEMEKYLKKYFRLLLDTKINQEDSKIVIDLILLDQKGIDYIKKYDSFDDYVVATIKKRIDAKPKKTKIQQVVKNRSHVTM